MRLLLPLQWEPYLQMKIIKGSRCMKNLINIMIFIILSSIIYPQGKGGFWTFSGGDGSDTAEWDSVDNNGTLVNSAHYSSQNGNNGSYLNLDAIGGNDYLIVEDDADLDFNNENIGISVWIYPKSLTDVHYIINKGDQYVSPKTTNYSVRISKNKTIEFLIRDQNDQAKKVASTFTVTEDAWQFIAVYYDFSNKVVHFWNSNTADPNESIAFEVEPLGNNDPLAIGSWYKSEPQNSSVKDFEGWIDEVRISGRKEDLFPKQLGIHEENGSKENPLFTIYPNPINRHTTRSSISINFDYVFNEKFVIKIYSLLGKEIYSKSYNSVSANNHFSLPIKNLNAGLYFVSLINPYRTQTTKLLILK